MVSFLIVCLFRNYFLYIDIVYILIGATISVHVVSSEREI